MYCSKVNIPVTNPLFNKDHLVEKSTKSWVISSADLTDEFHGFLDSVGLRVFFPVMFRTPAFETSPIHIDGGIASSCGKLNYVFSGVGTKMSWYRPLVAEPTLTFIKGKEMRLRPFLSYAEQDAELVHSQELDQWNIVSVGVPHNIINNTAKDRYCLSVNISLKDAESKITFEDLLIVLRNYIVK
jgi:hypothetical protein